MLLSLSQKWISVVSEPALGSPTYCGESGVDDRDAHRTSSAGDDLRGLIDVVGVEVGLLGLGDLADLVPGDLGDLGLVRLAGALLDTSGLEQQARGRRRLQLEVERPVFVHGDLNRDDVPTLRLGRRVVLLAELHDVDAVLTQRGADRRRRVGRTGLDLQLDDRRKLLLLGWHFFVSFLLTFESPAHLPVRGDCRPSGGRQILETWVNDSSTGVSRPKIDTRTFSFCPSTLTSEIVAGSVANGPSMTVTDSPISKSTSTAGPPSGAAVAVDSPLPPFAGASLSTFGARNFRTSSTVSGDGREVAPTNPVTPGVLRTALHEASFRSIRTRM